MLTGVHLLNTCGFQPPLVFAGLDRVREFTSIYAFAPKFILSEIGEKGHRYSQ